MGRHDLDAMLAEHDRLKADPERTKLCGEDLQHRPRPQRDAIVGNLAGHGQQTAAGRPSRAATMPNSVR